MNELSQALVGYLTAVYNLSRKSPAVRVTDMAAYLKISKPSANRAVNVLKQHGLVSHEPYGDVLLTDKGYETALCVCNRHSSVKRFLVEVLALDEHVADTEAASIEHALSAGTVEKMASYLAAV
jgi:Mn-dependent DtxR family transcriptional regulator